MKPDLLTSTVKSNGTTKETEDDPLLLNHKLSDFTKRNQKSKLRGELKLVKHYQGLQQSSSSLVSTMVLSDFFDQKTYNDVVEEDDSEDEKEFFKVSATIWYIHIYLLFSDTHL